MVTNERFTKLEEKVEKVKEDVSELKLDLKSHIIQSNLNMEVVKEHVAGDKKIINTIEPLLKELPDLITLIKEYQLSQLNKQKRREMVVDISKKVTIFSGITGGIAALYKLFF